MLNDKNDAFDSGEEEKFSSGAEDMEDSPVLQRKIVSGNNRNGNDPMRRGLAEEMDEKSFDNENEAESGLDELDQYLGGSQSEMDDEEMNDEELDEKQEPNKEIKRQKTTKLRPSKTLVSNKRNSKALSNASLEQEDFESNDIHNQMKELLGEEEGDFDLGSERLASSERSQYNKNTVEPPAEEEVANIQENLGQFKNFIKKNNIFNHPDKGKLFQNLFSSTFGISELKPEFFSSKAPEEVSKPVEEVIEQEKKLPPINPSDLLSLKIDIWNFDRESVLDSLSFLESPTSVIWSLERPKLKHFFRDLEPIRKETIVKLCHDYSMMLSKLDGNNLLGKNKPVILLNLQDILLNAYEYLIGFEKRAIRDPEFNPSPRRATGNAVKTMTDRSKISNTDAQMTGGQIRLVHDPHLTEYLYSQVAGKEMNKAYLLAGGTQKREEDEALTPEDFEEIEKRLSDDSKKSTGFISGFKNMMKFVKEKEESLEFSTFADEMDEFDVSVFDKNFCLNYEDFYAFKIQRVAKVNPELASRHSHETFRSIEETAFHIAFLVYSFSEAFQFALLPNSKGIPDKIIHYGVLLERTNRDSFNRIEGYNLYFVIGSQYSLPKPELSVAFSREFQLLNFNRVVQERSKNSGMPSIPPCISFLQAPDIVSMCLQTMLPTVQYIEHTMAKEARRKNKLFSDFPFDPFAIDNRLTIEMEEIFRTNQDIVRELLKAYCMVHPFVSTGNRSAISQELLENLQNAFGDFYELIERTEYNRTRIFVFNIDPIYEEFRKITTLMNTENQSKCSAHAYQCISNFNTRINRLMALILGHLDLLWNPDLDFLNQVEALTFSCNMVPPELSLPETDFMPPPEEADGEDVIMSPSFENKHLLMISIQWRNKEKLFAKRYNPMDDILSLLTLVPDLLQSSSEGIGTGFTEFLKHVAPFYASASTNIAYQLVENQLHLFFDAESWKSQTFPCLQQAISIKTKFDPGETHSIHPQTYTPRLPLEPLSVAVTKSLLNPNEETKGRNHQETSHLFKQSQQNTTQKKKPVKKGGISDKMMETYLSKARIVVPPPVDVITRFAEKKLGPLVGMKFYDFPGGKLPVQQDSEHQKQTENFSDGTEYLFQAGFKPQGRKDQPNSLQMAATIIEGIKPKPLTLITRSEKLFELLSLDSDLLLSANVKREEILSRMSEHYGIKLGHQLKSDINQLHYNQEILFSQTLPELLKLHQYFIRLRENYFYSVDAKFPELYQVSTRPAYTSENIEMALSLAVECIFDDPPFVADLVLSLRKNREMQHSVLGLVYFYLFNGMSMNLSNVLKVTQSFINKTVDLGLRHFFKKTSKYFSIFYDDAAEKFMVHMANHHADNPGMVFWDMLKFHLFTNQCESFNKRFINSLIEFTLSENLIFEEIYDIFQASKVNPSNPEETGPINGSKVQSKVILDYEIINSFIEKIFVVAPEDTFLVSILNDIHDHLVAFLEKEKIDTQNQFLFWIYFMCEIIILPKMYLLIDSNPKRLREVYPELCLASCFLSENFLSEIKYDLREDMIQVYDNLFTICKNLLPSVMYHIKASQEFLVSFKPIEKFIRSFSEKKNSAEWKIKQSVIEQKVKLQDNIAFFPPLYVRPLLESFLAYGQFSKTVYENYTLPQLLCSYLEKNAVEIRKELKQYELENEVPDITGTEWLNITSGFSVRTFVRFEVVVVDNQRMKNRFFNENQRIKELRAMPEMKFFRSQTLGNLILQQVTSSAELMDQREQRQAERNKELKGDIGKNEKLVIESERFRSYEKLIEAFVEVLVLLANYMQDLPVFDFYDKDNEHDAFVMNKVNGLIEQNLNYIYSHFSILKEYVELCSDLTMRNKKYAGRLERANKTLNYFYETYFNGI